MRLLERVLREAGDDPGAADAAKQLSTDFPDLDLASLGPAGEKEGIL